MTKVNISQVMGETINRLAQLRREGWVFVTGRSPTRLYGYVRAPNGAKRDVYARNEWSLLNKYLKAVKTLQDHRQDA